MKKSVVPPISLTVHLQAVNEILKCNEETEKIGIILTVEQTAALINKRLVEMRKSGYFEYGSGIIEKLVMGFYRLPYASNENFTQLLLSLISDFYACKINSPALNDDEIIEKLKKSA